MSADIVGSTPLKQPLSDFEGRRGASETWLGAIQGFYREMYTSFLSSWNSKDDGPPPVLWKTVGDEIIFWKELTHHSQAHATLDKWIRAVEQVKEGFLDKFKSLDVKCTGWIAGFPVRNRAVLSDLGTLFGGGAAKRDVTDRDIEEKLAKIYESIDRSDAGGAGEPEASLDFIGPGIDIGFRLAAQSTARRFVISVDLAYVLQVHYLDTKREKSVSPIDVHFDRSDFLKGVFGGVHYPIFFIKMRTHELDDLEDRLLAKREADGHLIQRYCMSFYERHSAYTFQPFINSRRETQLDSMPEFYEGEVRRLAARHGELLAGVPKAPKTRSQRTSGARATLPENAKRKLKGYLDKKT